MAFKKLERWEAEQKRKEEIAAATAAELAERKRIQALVRESMPKRLKPPKRGKGRSATSGFSKRELALLKSRAQMFLSGAPGLQALEQEVQQTALVILLIDGMLGTEPWRSASAGPHAGIIPANARMRYLESASRLLEDLRSARGLGPKDESSLMPPLLEGVFDAELAGDGTAATPEPASSSPSPDATED